MKFLFYLCLSFTLSVLTDLTEIQSFSLNFQLISQGKPSAKKGNQIKKSSPPLTTTQIQKNKKTRKAAAPPIRSLSSTHIQTEVKKYQQAFLYLCAQEEGIDPKEKFLFFTQHIDSLRQFINEKIQSSKGEDKIILSRMKNDINEEALPDKKIVKEKSSFEEKASTLKHFFKVHYRHYHGIPENQAISAELPKILLKALDCISTSEPR